MCTYDDTNYDNRTRHYEITQKKQHNPDGHCR